MTTMTTVLRRDPANEWSCFPFPLYNLFVFSAFLGLCGVAASSLVWLDDLVLVSVVTPFFKRSDVNPSFHLLLCQILPYRSACALDSAHRRSSGPRLFSNCAFSQNLSNLLLFLSVWWIHCRFLALPASWPLRWCLVAYDHNRKMFRLVHSYLKHFGHCTRSSILETLCRSRLPFCSAWISESWCDAGESSMFSVFSRENFLIKWAVIGDLCGEFKTCFVKLEIRKGVLLSRLVHIVRQIDLICASQFVRQESPPAWSKPGVSFETKHHLQKWQHGPVRLLACCRTKQSCRCYFDEIPILRFEHVVDWIHKYNRGLGSYFACSVPFLVHHLVLSTQSFAVSMTDFPDSEVRRKKLVSCFLDSIFLPTDHSLGLICTWKSWPCGTCVPSNSTVSVSKRPSLDWF